MATKKNGTAVEKIEPAATVKPQSSVEVLMPLSLPRYDEVFDDIQGDIQRLRDGKETETNARIISNQRRNQLKYIDSVIQYARLTRGLSRT